MSTFAIKPTIYKLHDEEVRFHKSIISKDSMMRTESYGIAFVGKDKIWAVANVVSTIWLTPQVQAATCRKYYQATGWGEETHISDRMINFIIQQIENEELNVRVYPRKDTRLSDIWNDMKRS